MDGNGKSIHGCAECEWGIVRWMGQGVVCLDGWLDCLSFYFLPLGWYRSTRRERFISSVRSHPFHWNCRPEFPRALLCLEIITRGMNIPTSLCPLSLCFHQFLSIHPRILWTKVLLFLMAWGKADLVRTGTLMSQMAGHLVSSMFPCIYSQHILQHHLQHMKNQLRSDMARLCTVSVCT